MKQWVIDLESVDLLAMVSQVVIIMKIYVMIHH